MWLFKPHSVWTGPHVAYPDPNIRLSTPGPPEGKVHRKGKGKKNKKKIETFVREHPLNGMPSHYSASKTILVGSI